MFTGIIDQILVYWPALFTSLLITSIARNHFYRGLNKYPGHALSGFMNWWRFFDILNGHPERTHIALHQRYGDIVRLGLNVLSFANLRAARIIHGLNQGMTKSDFYPVQQGTGKGARLKLLFTTEDEVNHAQYRRCINSAFIMSSLVSYEPRVDSTTSIYVEKTQELFVEPGQRCNFSQGLQFYAFDVIDELSWSKRLGNIERNVNDDGIVQFISKFLDYAAPLSSAEHDLSFGADTH